MRKINININSLVFISLFFVFITLPVFINADTSDGTEDVAFYTSLGSAFNGSVNSIAIQSDEDVLVGGGFNIFNMNTRNKLVRLNSDGTEDTDFYTNLGDGFNGDIRVISIQSDNKILVGGDFDIVNNEIVSKLTRLNSNGTLDSNFNINLGDSFNINSFIKDIKVQNDGDILVGGSFFAFNGNTRNKLVRLNSDGTEDTDFYTNLGDGFDDRVESISIQDDGDVLVGGYFTSFNSNPRNGLVRLNSDGTEDTDFYTNLGNGFNGNIEKIIVQNDGYILIGGGFTSFNSNPRNGLVRLNSDGTEDTDFYTNLGSGFDSTIKDIKIQNDGDILIGGGFTSFNSNPRNGLVRLNSDGTEDTDFYTNLGSGFNWSILNIVIQTNEDIIISGNFTLFNNNSRNSLIRITYDKFPPILSESTPITTPSNDTTPNYTFTTDEGGTITYGGSCSSSITEAVVGNNTITFNELEYGTYSDCTITVTDVANNASNPLSINSFEIVRPPSSGSYIMRSTVLPPPVIESVIPPVVIPVIIPPVTPTQPKEEIKKNVIEDKKVIEEEKVEETDSKKEGITELISEVSNNSNSNTNLNENVHNSQKEEISENSGDNFAISFVKNIVNPVVKTTKNVINKGRETAKKALETTNGDIAFKLITFTGVIGALGLRISNSIFANPISFSEISYVPLRLSFVFLSIFNSKNKKKYFGTVYDSFTKEPIDPAYVILRNEVGKEIKSTLTDIEGRYSFSVPKGIYTLEVNKYNYSFPSSNLKGVHADKTYDNLYTGERIVIEEPEGIIDKNIPLDPLNFDIKEFEKEKETSIELYLKKIQFKEKIIDYIFYLGFIITIVSLFSLPKTYSIIIFIIYIFIYILRNINIKNKIKFISR